MEAKKTKLGRRKVAAGEKKKVINVWVKEKHLPKAKVECMKIQKKYDTL